MSAIPAKNFYRTTDGTLVLEVAPEDYVELTDELFAAQSEHVELRGHQAYVHSATPEPFDGFHGATLTASRSKLQGDAPLCSWELEQVQRDADRAARHLETQS